MAVVTKSQKEKRLGQKGKVVWFTGLSGSGKTSIATALEQMLADNGFLTVLLDGDVLRTGLNKNLGFSLDDRNENIRRAAEVANYLKKRESYASPALYLQLRK